MIPIISSNLSALRAFGKKMAVIANSVANINSEGFKKSRAVLKEGPVNDVSVEISKVETPGPLVPVEEDGKTVLKETSSPSLYLTYVLFRYIPFCPEERVNLL